MQVNADKEKRKRERKDREEAGEKRQKKSKKEKRDKSEKVSRGGTGVLLAALGMQCHCMCRELRDWSMLCSGDAQRKSSHRVELCVLC